MGLQQLVSSIISWISKIQWVRFPLVWLHQVGSATGLPRQRSPLPHFWSILNRPSTVLSISLGLFLLVHLQSCGSQTAQIALPFSQEQLTAQQLAVIYNQADPLSIRIARYYQQRRNIPPENVIGVNFVPNRTILSPEEFQTIKTQIDARLPATIQAFALTWAAPYRVGCMSITSAFAFAFDPAFCAQPCHLTKNSPYFNYSGAQPFTDLHIRPTMAIAATNFRHAKTLIDRGVKADHTFPGGTAYLLSTSDQFRNVRVMTFPSIVKQLGWRFKIFVLQADALENKSDVMFYFTGLAQVDKIHTNRFLPGAIADHMTSVGGMLTDSFQMSSLRWLEAGATGSYGSTVEPCNFPQKFPHPGVVMYHYLRGDTLLEAYWKGVQQPGEGIFIGEPLARPFG